MALGYLAHGYLAHDQKNFSRERAKTHMGGRGGASPARVPNRGLPGASFETSRPAPAAERVSPSRPTPRSSGGHRTR